MLNVLLFGLEIDQDIINKNHDKLIEVWRKDVIHQVHEYRRSTGNSEWHNKELEMSTSHLKGSLRYILSFHPHLVITRIKI